MRRRRLAVPGIALSLALVGGTAVGALTRAPRDTAAVGALPLPAAAPPPAVTPSPSPPAAPTPSATPRPTRSPAPERTPATAAAAPKPSARPAPDPTETPRLKDPHPVFDGVPVGTIQTPYVRGQTSWDVTMRGIRLRVSIPKAIRAGEQMTWRVEVSGTGDCCTATILYGDGYETGGCEAAPSFAFPHVYNRAGRHAFAVQSARAPCVGGPASLTGWFDVLPGTTTAQGPAKPTVAFDSYGLRPGYETDTRYVSLYVEAIDADGYFSKLVVDFGDGTSRTFSGDALHQGACRRSGDGWPLESYAWLHYDPPEYHRYDTAGTFTLTITAYSTGCDRTSDPQTATASFDWHVHPNDIAAAQG